MQEKVDGNKGTRGVSYEEYMAQKGKQAARVTEAKDAIPASGHLEAPFTPNNCQAVTKNGTSCKARPVKGNHLCVGHLKQMEVLSG